MPARTILRRSCTGRRRPASALADGSFDYVLCIEVLRYLSAPGRCVAEMARYSGPGRRARDGDPAFNLDGYALVNRVALALPARKLHPAEAVLRHLGRGRADVQAGGLRLGRGARGLSGSYQLGRASGSPAACRTFCAGGRGSTAGWPTALDGGICRTCWSSRRSDKRLGTRRLHPQPGFRAHLGERSRTTAPMRFALHASGSEPRSSTGSLRCWPSSRSRPPGACSDTSSSAPAPPERGEAPRGGASKARDRRGLVRTRSLYRRGDRTRSSTGGRSSRRSSPAPSPRRSDATRSRTCCSETSDAPVRRPRASSRNA